MPRFPELSAGFVDHNAVVAIAVQLLQAVKAVHTPFGLDVSGAERILKSLEIDADNRSSVDLELWAEEVGATDDTPQPYRGRVCNLGHLSRSHLVTQVAASLVIVTENTPNFPFSDGKMARRLLGFMGVDVDKSGDVDLDRIATQRSAR